MTKNKLSKYFIFISILSFLTVFSAIIQKSYFNLVNPIKKVESNTLLTPINPDLDVDIIQEIKKRPENIETESLNFSLSDSIATVSGETNNL